MDILLCVAISLFAGLFMTRAVKPFGLPAVTGYLIAGVLVGPYCLGALSNLISVPGIGYSSLQYADGCLHISYTWDRKSIAYMCLTDI